MIMRRSVLGFLDVRTDDLYGLRDYDLSRVLTALPRVQARLFLLVRSSWDFRQMLSVPPTMSAVCFGENNNKFVYCMDSSHPDFGALMARYAHVPETDSLVRSALAVVFMQRDDLSVADIMQTLALSSPQ